MQKALQTSEEILNKFPEKDRYLLKTKKSVAIGFEVMMKFHVNQISYQKKRNPFASWTLNKVAVIDEKWLQEHKTTVQDMDWWRVKIEEETSPNQAMGCFIVRPLWKVEQKDLVILAPSTWTQVHKGQTVFLYPKLQPWMSWIIPKALRRLIMRKTNSSALIIPLSYPPEGNPEKENVPNVF
jgi:hypothetical protein